MKTPHGERKAPLIHYYCVSHNVPHQCCFFRHSVVKRTDPVDKLKDEAEFATSPERLAHLDDVFVFKTAQQAQLT